ncbi:hypothetical protein M406DRAFT_346198 [Cryphonectria parasitica EP155]|uniref:Protein PNS1 n=1 Tax=Cryphonectria parasitica (strain ATCC 38755 / EP155) TaxID=660469 RepID=A0A9P5CQK0_CRYP1|nr:uncharacterized protein M406DRAFT_346198 [Cryphonectria parasitica EP155]KAF3766145.1 hypothetical protein M406DRAFT_346198 [Cryphonectria parasitica EP155]
MFSEYASRFLAQSQSRLSNFQGQTDNGNGNGNGNDAPAHRQPGDWSRASRHGGRSFLGAARGTNPYQPAASRFGHLTFASRYSTTQDAPLFQSARDELREDDDEDERDREAVDLYALQQSRRVFQTSRLEESTEPEDEGSRGSLEQSQDHEEEGRAFLDRAHTRGIKSSWNGPRSSFVRRGPDHGGKRGGHEGLDRVTSNSSDSSSGRGRMEDVGLESTIADGEPPADLTMEASVDDHPPAFQRLRGTTGPARVPLRRNSIPESELEGEIFKHDAFFAWVYLIALAAMFATFSLVWLHTTTTQNGSKPIGDTIYTVLRSSFHLLAVDTLVAIIVSFVWLAALRYFVRPLVALILVAVPVIMLSFAIYPFVSSFQGPGEGSSLQDIVMRWASMIPGFFALIWIYMVWKGRRALTSSIAILEFSSRILAANNALVLVGMGALSLIVFWTWAWLAMFTRVFLGGSYSGTLSRYIIQASTWWLGAYFLLMYLWTLSMIAGVQRGTTAATVSQWYFHRNAVPAVASRDIVMAALNHSVTTIFGTISLSTLLAIVVRLPLLVLHRRIAGIIAAFFYTLVPTSIVAMTNPLTLTYAAIHSQPLVDSARGLSQMDFLGPQAPTTTLTPRNLKHRGSAPLLPYRLAKLLLHATRFIMATALGFAGWVITARQLKVALPEGSLKGSAYAYMVGLVASFIGWGILGAMEGILSSIVDAVIICYGSETKMASGGGGYCMEAAQLFGGRGRGTNWNDAEY